MDHGRPIAQLNREEIVTLIKTFELRVDIHSAEREGLRVEISKLYAQLVCTKAEKPSAKKFKRTTKWVEAK
jgi:hypothetical protein